MPPAEATDTRAPTVAMENLSLGKPSTRAPRAVPTPRSASGLDAFRSQYAAKNTIATINNGGIIRASPVDVKSPDVAAKFFLVSENFSAGEAVLKWEHQGLVTCADPHVLRTEGVISTKQASYLITELCDGDMYALTETITEMPKECFVSVYQQMLAGVKACHSKGIAHRDIKAENFFVKFSNGATPASFADPKTVKNVKVLLGDFGFWTYSRDTCDDVVMSHEVCGSDVYGAPEQCMRELKVAGGYDPERADIFSLGVCLFMFYCGFPPWETNQVDSDPYTQMWARGNIGAFWNVMEHHLGKKKCTPAFEHLFTSMCSIDPADRPTIDEVINHPFLVGGKAEKDFKYKYPAVHPNKKIALKYSTAVAERYAKSRAKV